MSFTRWLAEGRNGDPEALAGLFGRWRQLLTLQARQLLGADLSARVEPADVVQEALAQAFQDLDQFRGHSEAEWVAWLRRLVAGHAVKARRHHQAEKRDAAADHALPETGIADADPGPAAHAQDHEEAARLAAAVEALPGPMREVVVRRAFRREPFEAVARALGRSPGAARVLWTRALHRLREALQGPPE